MIRDLAIPIVCKSKRHTVEVLVSAEDYIVIRKYGNWSVSCWIGKTSTKHYAYRSIGGKPTYMHKLVLNLSGIKQPSVKHRIGDHKDGNSLNNTRSNLRWATPQMNARNPFGFVTKQMELDL